MKSYIFIICLWFISSSLMAQHLQSLAKDLIPLSQVEQMVMPLQNNSALFAQERTKQSNHPVKRFAQKIETNATTVNRGTWEFNADNTAIWRLRILSPSAKSLNLGFSKYIMPEDGKLFLYASDLSQVIGPLTQADNEEHESLWTPMIKGEEIVIEIQVPMEKRADLQLQLDYVNHDFIGIQSMMSGNCHIDINCGTNEGYPEIEAYREVAQSVGMYSINGEYLCTGFLVNNTAQDCKPLFMTAYHCNVTEENAPSVVVYWNYQNSTCRLPNGVDSGMAGDGPLTDFNTGTKLRAKYAPSDMALLELDDPVSETANAFFAGWNASDTIPQNAVCIHHPNTEEKRISFEQDPLSVGNWPNGNLNADGDHLIVSSWDMGTTEEGSSGAPLFNEQGQVVGQLHGGEASCTNDAFDTFGWLHHSWEGGGTPKSRLKDWLNPENVPVLALNGRSHTACSFLSTAAPSVKICQPEQAIFAIQIGEDFDSSVHLELIGLSPSSDISFSANPAMPGTEVLITISNTSILNKSFYALELKANNHTVSKNLQLFVELATDTPEKMVLQHPAHTSQDVSLTPLFSWEKGTHSHHYFIQIAETMDFSTLLVEESTDQSFYEINTVLETGQNYFWRVKGINTCGEGLWSDIASFVTIPKDFEGCTDIKTLNVPLTIDHQSAGIIQSVIHMPAEGKIEDLNVTIKGKHSWLSDLTFKLTSPTGTTVVLIDQLCEGYEDFYITLDDEAEAGDLPCPYQDENSAYLPNDALTAFDNEPMKGDWILTIEDHSDADGGQLEAWNLDICTGQMVGIELPCINPKIHIYPNPSTDFITIDLSQHAATAISYEIFSMKGQSMKTDVLYQDFSTIELLDLPAGIYVLNLKMDGDTWTRKITVVD